MARCVQFLILLFLVLVLSLPAVATHIRSVDIKVQTTSNPLIFAVKLTVYRNTESNSQAGAFAEIYFGDGRLPVRLLNLDGSPDRQLRADLGPNIETLTFNFTVTYQKHGTYQLTYIEGDRSSNIKNIPFSEDVDYMTYVSFNTMEAVNSHLPELSIPPVDRACLYNTFTHNPGVVDQDGDLITFQLAVPSFAVGQEIPGYSNPASPAFYLDFSHGNESGTGPPTFAIDSLTGQLTWDAPGLAGEYSIAFKILEWRKDLLTEEYKLISTTIRDMQIIVDECINVRPALQIPTNLCLFPGTNVDRTIYGFDPENREVKIEAVSELFELPADQSPASYTPFPPEFRLVDPVKKYDSLTFHWKTECHHIRTQPHQVVFKISDRPPHEISLVAYKTWSIKVMGTAPEWKAPMMNLAKRQAHLSWKPYTCATADRIQIWRRVDSYPYTPGPCDIGIPKTLDFDLIGEVDGGDTTFIDDNKGRNLVDGAQYCYRLVAVFDGISITSSKPSAEFCFDPIETDAPVITHVSVVSTHKTEGNIRVSWRSPFEINKTQFPEPYQYHVYRLYGFDSAIPMEYVDMLSGDTTFLDEHINTLDSAFHYRIVLYAKPQGSEVFVPVDTSAKASSVRLMLTPDDKKITLVWRDSVPWSNVVNNNPWHVIYRRVGTDHGAAFEKYDSVNVAADGFMYDDDGLLSGELYAYKVLTRGTYGNPAIARQENFSQIAVAYPINNLKPCAPIVVVERTDCDQYLSAENCDQSEFSNVLHWRIDTSQGCRADIDHYKVYAAPSEAEALTLISGYFPDTLYVDGGLSSYARCYRVSAVDQSGQESPMSEVQCNDNCTSFELPSVFTPNGDGCNDVFSTYYAGEGQGGCTPINANWCPRFVNYVDLAIFNRWGNEVYHYTSGNGKPPTIYWDGKDQSRDNVEVGIYYYHVQVAFHVLEPTKRKGTYKGWVHVVR